MIMSAKCIGCGCENNFVIEELKASCFACQQCGMQVIKIVESVGYIYAIKNQFMPNMVKIGFTTRGVEERMSELSNHAGVPGKYEAIAYWPSNDPATDEKIIHNKLSDKKMVQEFFNIEESLAVRYISDILGREPLHNKAGIPPKKDAEDHSQAIGKYGIKCSNCAKYYVQTLPPEDIKCPYCGEDTLGVIWSNVS